ncbi:MAG: hypothetical protein R3C19_22615 [Planctomycetaceae bacterium]
MTKFLVRTFDDVSVTLGKRTQPTVVRDVVIREINCPNGKLPRMTKGYKSIGEYQNGNSFVPWAITSAGRVVYAQTGGHSGTNDRNFGQNSRYKLRKYDSILSHERRRLCESELGMIALNNMSLTRDAVQKVSRAMIEWLEGIASRQRFQAAKSVFQQSTAAPSKSIQQVLFDEFGHYMHTYDDNRKQALMGFGRFSEKSKNDVGPERFWREVIQALRTGRLDQIMSIHDAIGRKVLPKFGGPQQVPYDNIGGIVRKPWFDDPQQRGRTNASTKATPTTVGGTVPTTQGAQVPATAVNRNRGVDMFARDLNRTRHDEADDTTTMSMRVTCCSARAFPEPPGLCCRRRSRSVRT